MAIAQSIKKYRDYLTGLAKAGDANVPVNRHVLVLEQATGGAWKAIEAEIDRESIAVLGTHVLADEALSRGPRWLPNGNNARVALIPDSRRSVCRILDIANASPSQVEQMVALRLEVELPYPVAECTWVCEPQTNGMGAASQTLLIAAATQEITNAEIQLRDWGIRAADVEFAPAGLAELGLACDPSPETLAILHVNGDDALLVLMHARKLAYARHIRPASSDDGHRDVESGDLERLAKEVKQSIYDFQLRSGNRGPERLLIAGGVTSHPAFLETLAARLEIPVGEVTPPPAVRAVKPGESEDGLVADFPIALGVLVAMQRRAQGEHSAAPVLQRARSRTAAIDWRARGGTLVGLNALCLFLLLASLFGVQSIKMNSADRLIRESRPLLQGLEGLQEEVDILRYEEKRQVSQLDVLRALVEALPSDITIDSLTIDSKGKIAIGGKAQSVEAASGKAIAALEASTAFTNPQFKGATREKDAFGFQITCELRAAGIRTP